MQVSDLLDAVREFMRVNYPGLEADELCIRTRDGAKIVLPVRAVLDSPQAVPASVKDKGTGNAPR